MFLKTELWVYHRCAFGGASRLRAPPALLVPALPAPVLASARAAGAPALVLLAPARARNCPCRSPCAAPSGARAACSSLTSICFSPAQGACTSSVGRQHAPPARTTAKPIVVLSAASTAACVCVQLVAYLARKDFRLLRLIRGFALSSSSSFRGPGGWLPKRQAIP